MTAPSLESLLKDLTKNHVITLEDTLFEARNDKKPEVAGTSLNKKIKVAAQTIIYEKSKAKIFSGVKVNEETESAKLTNAKVQLIFKYVIKIYTNSPIFNQFNSTIRPGVLKDSIKIVYNNPINKFVKENPNITIEELQSIYNNFKSNSLSKSSGI